MRMLPSVPRRLLCAAIAAGLGILAANGGSYLQWRRTSAEQRPTIEGHP